LNQQKSEIEDPTTATAPQFDAARLRSSTCNVVSVARSIDGVDFAFGRRVQQHDAPGASGAELVHRVQLDLAAARQLEEVLTRVLVPAAATP
jgi:hypothetical protein